MLYSGVRAACGDAGAGPLAPWRQPDALYGGCSSGVERWTVAPEAAGSKPVIHPIHWQRAPSARVAGGLMAAALSRRAHSAPFASRVGPPSNRTSLDSPRGTREAFSAL